MGAHLKLSDRLELSILLKKGYSLRVISKTLKKDHSSLSREVKRRSTRLAYDPYQAERNARLKRKHSKYQGMKVRSNAWLENYVINGIRHHWTPEEIAGRLKDKYGRSIVSLNAIYKYLYSPFGQSLCHYLPYKRYSRKRRTAKLVKREIIKDRVFIDSRPDTINQRARFGDWEADVLGQPQFTVGAIVDLTERLSRRLLLNKQANSSYAVDGFKQMLNPYQEISQSVTMDNGSENASYKTLALSTYFCHPYSPWEKGSIENSFQRLRRFIPKRASPSKYTQHNLNVIMEIMNNTPRKCLGYRTPNEVFNEHLNKSSGAFEG